MHRNPSQRGFRLSDTDQNVTSGACYAFHASVNSNNQFYGSPFQYDAAGNMINDGNHTYFYDAENRLVQVDGRFGTCSTATACYFYDALGHRVDKQTGSDHVSYIHDPSGSPVTEYCAPCNWGTGWNRGNIYFSGQQVAEYFDSTTYFIHSDHLGSARILTTLNQSVYDSPDYLPLGEQIAGGTGTSYKFTGLERDSETNLDHTWFRQYSSQLGRWTQPDPAGLAAVDPSNPQSWNRYSYVTNNPLAYIDPLGLWAGCYTVENRDLSDFNEQQDSGGGPFEPDPQSPSAGCGRGGGGGLFDDGSWTLDFGYAGDDSGMGVGFPIGGGDLASQIGLMNVNVTPSYSWGITSWEVIGAMGSWNEIPNYGWTAGGPNGTIFLMLSLSQGIIIDGGSSGGGGGGGAGGDANSSQSKPMKASPTFIKCTQQAKDVTGVLAPNVESIATTVISTAASFLFPGATWLKRLEGLQWGNSQDYS